MNCAVTLRNDVYAYDRPEKTFVILNVGSREEAVCQAFELCDDKYADVIEVKLL